MARHRSSASPLACLYAALIVYASLYPFVGWHVPGVTLTHYLTLPWSRYWTSFDFTANLLGYLPLGALVFAALVRTGTRAWLALLLAVVAGTLLSLSMETLQNLLPQRVASNVDLALNALGTLLGAALGAWIHWLGGVERWQLARDRWFIARSAGGLALLLLWPVGLLFPLPVPLGVGQVLPHVQEVVLMAVQDTPAQAWLEAWIEPDPELPLLSAGDEFTLIALGLLAPCMLAFSVARPGWRRLVLALAAAALGGLATTLSTALNFGPQHAWAWSTPTALAAVVFALILASLLSVVPQRAAAGLGLMALTALVVFVSQAPGDPFFAASLQKWEQGRFIRFHGAARWVGLLWPYFSAAYLLARLGAADEAPKISP